MSEDGPPASDGSSDDDPPEHAEARGDDDPPEYDGAPVDDDVSGDHRDLHEHLTALHEHLAATEELPVDPAAARWIGEAQAVAADLAGDEDVSRGVVADRVGHVRDLLERMGDPGNDRARERVDAALSVVAAIEAHVRSDSDGELL